MSHECDCWQCIDPFMQARKEATVTTKQLTCTCGSRYVRDGEHEGDCDLWLIDEFWAGFLAWDWDREILVPTSMYPPGHQSDYVDSTEWVDDYLTQKDEQWSVENMSDEALGMKDEDIMLTTDAFINRMIANHPEDVDDTWVKGDDGLWKKVVEQANGTTVTTYGGKGHLPASYSNTSDKYDWTSWISDRHTQTPIVFPDGTKVHGTSLSNARLCDVVPDFALYLDPAWRADGLAIMIPWRDYGLPTVSSGMANYAIKEAFAWAKAGAFVEIGCIGAHGRTGTVMACMAILSDPEMSATEAIAYVREVFCEHSIESRDQEWYVEAFHAEEHSLPVPEKPVYVAPAQVVTTTFPKAEAAPQSPSAGPLGDPARKGKARRSRRGGKRTQNHRNRMAQGSRR